ncbi:MAG TPA: chorismate synthase [Vicinamibacterales bacterium]|nr:chorismate synthase [Vicinamibacterales bacterium]
MLRFLTAGESHGRALVVIVEGLPAGLPLSAADIAPDLRRRQAGYGRGRRMAIESDTAEILSGVRHGETLGSPVSFTIANRDWVNWQYTMSVEANPPEDAGGAHRAPVTRPRPGHADLSAGLKYDREDLRDILERASARETAARVGVGAIAKVLLKRAGIDLASHVIRIGSAAITSTAVSFEQIQGITDEDFRCVDPAVASAMKDAVDRAREGGDTLGGTFEVVAHNVPAGLGSHVQWDRKLDGLLAQALMSIPAIKGVGIGLGPGVGEQPGSAVHDEIVRSSGRPSGTLGTISRPSNRAGGLEGGVTNGEDVRVSAWMKPISTLMKPLRSVDLTTGESSPATIERSDVSAVPAASIVGEAVVSIVLASALLDKFGGDTVGDMDAAIAHYRQRLERRLNRGSGPA